MTPKTESKSILDNPKVVERAIVYCRVSTDEQAESGTSLDKQVAKGLAYAAATGLEVVAVFKEDFTGKVLERPELTKVREMLHGGLADNLIVFNANRYDRSEWGVNLLILMRELKNLGISLHYSQDNRRVDLNNPFEAFMYGSFAGWQAGEDHKETVLKLYDGRKDRSKAGFVVPHGRAPFGYRPVKVEKKWYFEIYEPEAVIVRLVYHWYIFGDETGKPLSIGAITDRLTEMGIPTQADNHKGYIKIRGKGVWNKNAVSLMLSNETYCGVWHYGKKGKDGLNPQDHLIAVNVPSIIDRELWEFAQKRRDYNKATSTRNRKKEYLLANRCTCPYCGYKMTGSKNKDWVGYYSCPAASGKEKGRTRSCDNLHYRADVADEAVWQWIEEILQDEEKLKRGLLAYQAQQEEIVNPVKNELEIINGLIEQQSQELAGLLETMKLLNSSRAKANVAQDIDRVDGTLDELEKRRNSLQEKLETKSITDEQIISLTELAAQVAADLEAIRGNFEAKRRLLELLDVQVTFFADNLAKRQRKAGRKVRVTAKFCLKGKVIAVEAMNNCIRG